MARLYLYPCPGSTGSPNVLAGHLALGSIARIDGRGSDGWASGVCGAVRAEERCIEHPAGLRWPDGFVCSGCGGRPAWRLRARPRVYECGTCNGPESVTAGTVFHGTRTDLSKWFLAAYLMGRDKRGVSAKFLQRELGVAYQTAWTMGTSWPRVGEDPAIWLRGFLEADEIYRRPRSRRRGRSAASPTRAWSSPPWRRCPPQRTRPESTGTRSSASTASSRQRRIAVLPAATGAELGAFLTGNVAAGSHLLTDGFAAYRGRNAPSASI